MTEPAAQPDTKVNLAVAMAAYNSMRTLPEVLESILPIADRIIIADCGSTDGTIEHCRERGCTVLHRDWDFHANQKRFAIENCLPAKWVLLLDSDETLMPDLQQAIRQAVDRDDPDVTGYQINRKLWYLGGWLNHVYFPEWRLRLFRPEKHKIVGHVHDKIVVEGKVKNLDGICKHDSFESLQDQAARQVRYAAMMADKGKKGRWWYLFTSPVEVFLKMVIRKQCYRDGLRGWIAFGMAVNEKLLKQTFRLLLRLEQKGTGRDETK